MLTWNLPPHLVPEPMAGVEHDGARVRDEGGPFVIENHVLELPAQGWAGHVQKATAQDRTATLVGKKKKNIGKEKETATMQQNCMEPQTAVRKQHSIAHLCSK